MSIKQSQPDFFFNFYLEKRFNIVTCDVRIAKIKTNFVIFDKLLIYRKICIKWSRLQRDRAAKKFNF